MTNPLSGNSFSTRADAQDAVRSLTAPLLGHFSQRRGRLRLGPGAAHFHEAAADLEGLSRPFWGLAPLAAGGGAFEHWAPFQAGLAAGSDPGSPDYWGPATVRDQRIVESAAIGFALALAPDVFWDGLPGAGRDTLARWLITALEAEPNPNNWMFFRVIVSLGLDRVGVHYNRAPVDDSLAAMDALDIGNGWYRDGPNRRADHYVPFAMHYYALIYATLGTRDEDRRERFRERAAVFAPQFARWFAADGACLPFGRSLTYRFAHAGFWGAMAFAGIEGIPWGEARGLWARNLRWWSHQPMADRDGVLPIGYAYPNLNMSEQYNSPGSPYWAMKAFLPLALGDDHPFWTAEEAPTATTAAQTVTQTEPGIVLMSSSAQVVALTGGQEALTMRYAAEKYCKFAYSTRYAFSVESHPRVFETGAFDNMLAFSDDGRHYRVRDGELDARVGEGVLYSRWSPMTEVEVETWVMAAAPWHVRVHRIVSDRTLQVAEGGFAVRRSDDAPLIALGGPGRAEVQTNADISAIISLNDTISRVGRVQKADPNTNLMYSRTWVPQLRGTIAAGTTVLMSAVLASPDREAMLGAFAVLPPMPDIDALGRMRDAMPRTPVWDLPQDKQ